MLNDLHALIAARLTELDLFAYVGHALQDEQQKRPDALIWLEKGKQVPNSPARDHIWGIRLSVGHSDVVGVAPAHIYTLIDAVCDAFAGWQPAGVEGIDFPGFTLGDIVPAGHESNGPTAYLVFLSCRVFPKVFVKN